MATIQPSVLVSQIVGSAGSSTFSRNRGGNYAKVRKASTNPRTPFQQNFRNIFAALSAYWRSMTNTERESWTSRSSLFPYTNKIGIVKYYSGFNLFMKFNQTLQVGGFTTINTAPSPYAFPEFTDFRVNTLDSSNMILDCISSLGDSNTRYYVFASIPQSAGANYCSPSTYKFIGAYSNTGSDTLNIFSDYTNRLSTYSTGQDRKSTRLNSSH